jgi:rRNA maturation endonuclease Nob1
MPKHSHRAKWNTANAKLAQRLMDSMFYGYLDCLRCGKRWSPKAYEPVDFCPDCYKELEAVEQCVQSDGA